ncbi:MAG: hydantoinase B/oxoprolinase family protein [Gammaproteobacteria bacterium]
MNPVQLSLFVSESTAICREMGITLKRVALSPNIADRLDFSCALFSREGELLAQAAHIPVHLGSMAYAMKDLVSLFDWAPHDSVIVNDPYLGGTHLPDITIITPIFFGDTLSAFCASRAHHADIGGDTPGSMPLASNLSAEGLIIAPQYICRNKKLESKTLELLNRNLRTPDRTLVDILSQISANETGVKRTQRLIDKYGIDSFFNATREMSEYSELLARRTIKLIPDGVYSASDIMDGDGLGNNTITISASITIDGECAKVNFRGTAQSVSGNINCPVSVTAAAVYYVFYSLMPRDTPACHGSLKPIAIDAPRGCLVNAIAPSACAAGNVETSQRIVDVLLLALSDAIPDRIPASSQGTMNNLAMGNQYWGYYETIGGGTGGHSAGDGLSGVQSHMTNTLNTPVEIFEKNFPVMVQSYSIRRNSHGRGQTNGGNGLVREYRFEEPAQVTILSERRQNCPPGHHGGGNGSHGQNSLNGKVIPGKATFQVKKLDILKLETPGGAGWGRVLKTKN